MGTDGACGLFFCADKRGGTFPPNMPAELRGPCVTTRRFHEATLRVIVSSPAGAQLFVITGEAVTSRPRLSPILMGWWSAQCNDFKKKWMSPSDNFWLG